MEHPEVGKLMTSHHNSHNPFPLNSWVMKKRLSCIVKQHVEVVQDNTANVPQINRKKCDFLSETIKQYSYVKTCNGSNIFVTRFVINKRCQTLNSVRQTNKHRLFNTNQLLRKKLRKSKLFLAPIATAWIWCKLLQCFRPSAEQRNTRLLQIEQARLARHKIHLTAVSALG